MPCPITSCPSEAQALPDYRVASVRHKTKKLESPPHYRMPPADTLQWRTGMASVVGIVLFSLMRESRGTKGTRCDKGEDHETDKSETLRPEIIWADAGGNRMEDAHRYRALQMFCAGGRPKDFEPKNLIFESLCQA